MSAKPMSDQIKNAAARHVLDNAPAMTPIPEQAVDLIERLRLNRGAVDIPSIMNEAADEIERLTAAAPAGWQLVPVAPTEKMIERGIARAKANDRKMQDGPGYGGECDSIYRAMLAAVPATEPKEG